MADDKIKLVDLPELSDIPDDAFVYIVSDGLSYKGTKENLIKTLQDNIKKEIIIPCPEDTTTEGFAAILNGLATFEIEQTEIPTFKAVSEETNPTTYYVELIGKGKGLYGAGGFVLLPEHLKVTSFSSTISDVEDLSTTVVVDLGTSALTVSAVLNLEDPAIVIQDQTDGYTIFKIVISSVAYSYLWIGTAGVYGVDELQSTEADFQVLSDLPQVSSNLYVQKEESLDMVVSGSGVIGTFDMSSLKSSVRFTGTITELNSIQRNGFMRNGQPFYFKNDQAIPVKLGKLVSSGNLKFDGIFDLQPGEIMQFLGNVATMKLELVGIMPDSIGSSKKTQIIQFAWGGANYSANTNWWHLTPFVPKYGTSFENYPTINVSNAFADDNNYGFRDCLMFDGKIKAITVEGDNNGVNWNCDLAIRNFELPQSYNAGFSVNAYNNQIVARKVFIVGSGNNQRRVYFDAITDFGDLLLPKNSVLKPYFKSEGVANSNWQNVVLTILIEEV